MFMQSFNSFPPDLLFYLGFNLYVAVLDLKNCKITKMLDVRLIDNDQQNYCCSQKLNWLILKD